MPHLTEVQDADAILAGARAFKADMAGGAGLLEGKIVCMAFFEPSTRTRLSFEAAALRLGASVIGFSDAASTSSAKGESLEDTIRVLAGYADIIVLRHPETGAAVRAAAVTDVPVINAGDGAGLHPTQTLLDLLTLEESLGDLKGKEIAVVGDLRNGRTVHSLVPELERRGASVTQVPAGDLTMEGVETSTRERALQGDAIYMTRVQKERASDATPIRVDAASLAGSKAIILHPLPRVDELSADVDGLPGAKYFDQARNGVPTRMAVLAWALGALP